MTAKIRLYGCGGAGINIAKQYLKGDEKVLGQADIVPGFLDTSESNIKELTKSSESVFLVTKPASNGENSARGSGKKRAENFNEIKAQAKAMLQQIPPLELNIIVSSGSGGTGAMIAAVLASELITMKRAFVVLLIGSGEDKTALDNTVGAIKTLEGIRTVQNHPVNYSYFFNHRQTGRAGADEAVHEMISVWRFFASGENEEMDEQDMYNFLNYTNVLKDVPARLGLVEIYTDVESIEKNVRNPLSMASLYLDKNAIAPALVPAYSCTGFTPVGLTRVDRMHLVISTDPVVEIFRDLDAQLAKVTSETAAATSAHTGIVVVKDNADAVANGGFFV